MVADRNSTHASANGEQPSRRVCLHDQRAGPRTLLGADSEGNAGSSDLSSRGQSGGGSRSLAQSGGSPRTPERDLAVSNLDHPVGLDADLTPVGATHGRDTAHQGWTYRHMSSREIMGYAEQSRWLIIVRRM